jgi:hypothetical protein
VAAGLSGPIVLSQPGSGPFLYYTLGHARRLALAIATEHNPTYPWHDIFLQDANPTPIYAKKSSPGQKPLMHCFGAKSCLILTFSLTTTRQTREHSFYLLDEVKQAVAAFLMQQRSISINSQEFG